MLFSASVNKHEIFSLSSITTMQIHAITSAHILRHSESDCGFFYTIPGIALKIPYAISDFKSGTSFDNYYLNK